MLKTSSNIWLATSFLNLLKNKASLITWWILQARLYWDPHNWKAILSKPEHRTKQPLLISKLINFMWNNIKSTIRCISFDEDGVDTPKQCLMNKYNLDLSKNVLGLNHKKELYTKNVYTGRVIGPLPKFSLDSGIKRGC